MALPVKPLPESSALVNGTSVTFRSLSRTEALHVQTFANNEDGAEVFVLAKACSVSDQEAQAFLDSTPTLEAGKLLEAILVFSDLAKPGQITLRDLTGEEAEVPDPKQPMNGRSSQESLTLTSS